MSRGNYAVRVLPRKHGSMIKQKRLELGMTKSELSYYLGIDEGMLTIYEADVFQIPPLMVFKCRHFLNMKDARGS